MISYHSDSGDLEHLVEELGRVYADPITRSHLLLEEVEVIHESLLADYKKRLERLQQLNLEVIKYYLEQDEPLDRRLLLLAAREGDLDFIRFFVERCQGPRDTWVIEYAVLGGHLETVRALRDGSVGEVFPWDEWTVTWAVAENYPEIVRALRNGSLGEMCPWNKTICRHMTSDETMLKLIDSGELD